jgi:hypothetical protein
LKTIESTDRIGSPGMFQILIEFTSEELMLAPANDSGPIRDDDQKPLFFLYLYNIFHIVYSYSIIFVFINSLFVIFFEKLTDSC